MENFINQLQATLSGYVPTLLAAVAVLIVGWIVALLIASLVKRLLGKTDFDNKLVGWVGKDRNAVQAEKWIGRAVFWIAMVFVIIAFFQVLGLAAVSGPLQSFQTELFSFLPGLLSAAALLALAWVLATVVRMAVRRGLEAIDLDRRVEEGAEPPRPASDVVVETEPIGSAAVEGSVRGAPALRGSAVASQPAPLAKTLADTAYWLIFLLFLPAVLDALGLDGLLEPINQLMGRFLAFLPNLLAATVIVGIGWLAARIVRRVVTNLAAATGLDRLGDQVQVQGVLGRQRLSGVLGIVVYVLIMVPVLIAALNALQLEAVTQPASNMLNSVLSALPKLFAASVLLFLAYVVAKLLGGLLTQLLAAIGFDRLFQRFGFGERTDAQSRSASQILGSIAVITIMLFASIEALELLEFERLATLLAALTVFLGKVALGVVVFAAGLYLADLAARTIRSSGLSQANLLATSARVAILILAGAMALRQMDVAEDIINLAFGLTLGAAAVASAIAFGLGGRGFAQRRLEELEARRLNRTEQPPSTPTS